MIVEMKKAILFMKTAGKTEALEKIREAGVVHLTPVKPPETSSVESLRQLKEQTMLAIALLSDAGKNKAAAGRKYDPEEAVSVISEMNAEIIAAAVHILGQNQ